MCLANTILLLLASLTVLTLETCVDRRCPTGQFYNTTTNSCVCSCYPNYGNWDTGRCMEGKYASNTVKCL